MAASNIAAILRARTPRFRRLLTVPLALVVSLAPLSGALLALTSCGDPQPPPAAGRVTAGCVGVNEVRSIVHFDSVDGAILEGLELGRGPVGVVLAHEDDGDLCQWKPYAYVLAKAGYRVLAFTFDVKLADNVLAAANELRRKGANQVFLSGAAMGGDAVLAAAAEAKPRVDGVVSLSAPMAYGEIDAYAAAPRLTAPVLYVTSEDDPQAADAARDLYAASSHAAERKMLIVPGRARGIGLLGGEVRTNIESFLRDHARR